MTKKSQTAAEKGAMNEVDFDAVLRGMNWDDRLELARAQRAEALEQRARDGWTPRRPRGYSPADERPPLTDPAPPDLIDEAELSPDVLENYRHKSPARSAEPDEPLYVAAPTVDLIDEDDLDAEMLAPRPAVPAAAPTPAPDLISETDLAPKKAAPKAKKSASAKPAGKAPIPKPEAKPAQEPAPVAVPPLELDADHRVAPVPETAPTKQAAPAPKPADAQPASQPTEPEVPGPEAAAATLFREPPVRDAPLRAEPVPGRVHPSEARHTEQRTAFRFAAIAVVLAVVFAIASYFLRGVETTQTPQVVPDPDPVSVAAIPQAEPETPQASLAPITDEPARQVAEPPAVPGPNPIIAAVTAPLPPPAPSSGVDPVLNVAASAPVARATAPEIASANGPSDVAVTPAALQPPSPLPGAADFAVLTAAPLAMTPPQPQAADFAIGDDALALLSAIISFQPDQPAFETAYWHLPTQSPRPLRRPGASDAEIETVALDEGVNPVITETPAAEQVAVVAPPEEAAGQETVADETVAEETASEETTFPDAVVNSIAPTEDVANWGDGLRIHLHAPANVPQRVVDNLQSTLEGLGVAVQPPNRVGFSVASTQIRYYHAEDADIATELATAIEALPRDFTDFSPPPVLGTLEIYLAGTAPTARATTSTAQPRGIESVIQELRSRLLGIGIAPGQGPGRGN